MDAGQTAAESDGPARSAISAEITHTVNVVQQERSYFGGFEPGIVTKYIISVSVGAAGTEQLSWQVARRYSHFRRNHAALSSVFSALPKLPPRTLNMERLSGSSQILPNPDLVASRMVSLNTYLKQLLAIPAISASIQLRCATRNVRTIQHHASLRPLPRILRGPEHEP